MLIEKDNHQDFYPNWEQRRNRRSINEVAEFLQAFLFATAFRGVYIKKRKEKTLR